MHALGQALWGFQEIPHSSLRHLDVPRHAFDNAPRLQNFLKARAHKELFRGSLRFVRPFFQAAIAIRRDTLMRQLIRRRLPCLVSSLQQWLRAQQCSCQAFSQNRSCLFLLSRSARWEAFGGYFFIAEVCGPYLLLRVMRAAFNVRDGEGDAQGYTTLITVCALRIRCLRRSQLI
jgi:hypothetical protein